MDYKGLNVDVRNMPIQLSVITGREGVGNDGREFPKGVQMECPLQE
jgi:hypothetical protein